MHEAQMSPVVQRQNTYYNHHQEVFAEGSSNIIGLACGPLKKPRYINPKIEKELVEFKKEIEDKFEKSEVKLYRFPFIQEEGFLPEPRKSS
jgi:hypothetical protein